MATATAGAPGLERLHLRVVVPDDAVGGFGHLVPDAGDVAEGFGDDQPRVVGELLEQLRSGYSLRSVGTSVV